MEPRAADERVLPQDMYRVYEGAIYKVELAAGSVIFGGGAARTGEPPTGTLAIVTAFNPGRTRPGEAVNNEANLRLAVEIERLGYVHHPALGRNAEGTHLEPSFGIADIPECEAIELGRRFGQAAIFFWDGALARIVPC